VRATRAAAARGARTRIYLQGRTPRRRGEQSPAERQYKMLRFTPGGGCQREFQNPSRFSPSQQFLWAGHKGGSRKMSALPRA
jgi:hypothetical protein